MPAKQVEELHPGWLDVKNLIAEVSAGAGFADAHSLSLLAHWLISEKILTLQPETLNEALIFEKTQDWRTGFARLTLLRTTQNQSPGQTSFSNLPGFISPNSGSARIHELLTTSSSLPEVLSRSDQVKKDLVAISLPEILLKLEAGDFDIATMAAILKYLLQKNKVIINNSRFKAQA